MDQFDKQELLALEETLAYYILNKVSPWCEHLETWNQLKIKLKAMIREAKEAEENE